MRRALFLVLLITLPHIATAQDPNLARGFAPGKLYDVLGLDSVSTFNGNLNVRIPLGQRYTVGPVLQYQFMLAYNSKIWEFEYRYLPSPPTDPRKLPVPDTRSNAGLGWRLTLGELFPPKVVNFMPPTTGWTYVAADGSEHEFRTIDSDPVLAYTEDSSFLRLRRVTEAGIVYREIDFPDGTTHRFDTSGRLQKITDRHGNWIKVARTDYQWTVTDGYANQPARSHTIILEDGVNAEGEPYNQLNFKKRPVQVKLAAFGGTVATYTLAYDDVSLPVGTCAGNIVPLPNALVPLLERIDQPYGTSYVPSYQMQETERCTSGIITELTLPTLGKIVWQHGLYEMSFQECVPPAGGDDDIGWFGSYAGVTQRTLKDKSGTVVETRSYTPQLVTRAFEVQRCGPTGADNYNLMLPPEEFRNTITVTVPEGAAQKTIEKTTHYFSVFPAMANPFLPTPTFAKKEEYGLPLTRRESNGDRFLSSHTYACSGGSCSANLARTAYLKYGYLPGSSPATGYPKAIDPRVEAQRTVFNGDSCGGLCLYYSDSTSSDYDNYGHYRQTVLDGNLGGPARTLRTEYNPDAGAWLLNRYTASSVIENGQTTQRMTYTFDGAGFEQSRRTLKGTTAGTGDLLAVTCRDARGFVVSETFLGGDGRTPPDTLCAAASPVAQEYEIVHEYPPGDGFRTWHRARYSGNSFNIADETFDPSTGQVASTRDSAGLTTTYTYDSMARLTFISPPGAASSSLVYRNASSSEPARVTSTVASSPAIEHTYDFDDVGRLFREKRRMPDGSWALRKTDYRGAATMKFTSEWVALAAGADENLVTPTIGTTFEHDQFGRLTKVTAPDLKVMSAAYLNGGVREVQRTRTVATPSSSDTSVTVTEGYDLHGKLVSVREPAGPTTAAAPIGGEVRTDYGYDSGGKVVSVTMNPPAGSGTAAQQRQFTYDSRGLLISETHPEKELPTTYGSFDARGHAWTSTDADVTVSFEYDSAERLFRISNASGTPLKELTFGTASDCTYCNGKLRKAVRHNYLPGLGDHQVTETYTYGANGLPSNRETLVERPGSSQIQKFSQDFNYDQLLALDRVDYPTCLLNGCSTTNGLLNVDHTRTRGLLTQVSGFATIGYHSSGMVSEVQRVTSPVMTDTYEADQGMARPSKIKFTGATACTIPNSPVITASSFVCTGSTGNQASISNPPSDVTYTWTIQNGTLASTTGTSVSFTAGSSGQVTLNVTAQNACGTAASAPKTATIPQATVSGSTTIDAGGSTYVDVALTGTPPWSLTWSDGTVSSNITASPFQRQVSPAATTTYQLTAATDATSCSLVRTGSATITVRPPAPGWITAQATDRSVQINWLSVSVPGGARYDLERAENVNGPWTAVATATPQGSWVDTAPADPTGARRAYVYRVHTVAADGTRSPLGSSPRDYAVTATAMYPTGGITAGVTLIQAQHVVELRRGIDALRKLVNLPEVFVSQPAPSGWIMATTFTDLLTPLDQARGPFGYAAFVYSGVGRPTPGLLIKAEHVTQLREVLK